MLISLAVMFFNQHKIYQSNRKTALTNKNLLKIYESSTFPRYSPKTCFRLPDPCLRTRFADITIFEVNVMISPAVLFYYQHKIYHSNRETTLTNKNLLRIYISSAFPRYSSKTCFLVPEQCLIPA